MKKRGISEVLSVVLFILIGIVGVGILWVAISNMAKDDSSASGQDCLTIDIEPVSCNYFHNGCFGNALQQNVALIVLKRNQGEGDLRSVKLVFEDANGNKKPLDIEDYNFQLARFEAKKDISSVKEYETISVVTTGVDWISSPLDKLNLIALAGIVGDDKIVCNEINKPIDCPLTFPPSC